MSSSWLRLARAILLTTCAVLAACSGETVAQPPPAPVDWHSFQARATPDAGINAPTAKERAVAESYSAALQSQAFSELPARLDDDAHFAFPGMNDARGREAVVRAHEFLYGAFDQRKFVLSRVWRTESQQSVEWTMTGTQARDWMGVAATRKPVVIEGFTILWTKDDGSITDVHPYFQVALVKAQLGVGPKELLNRPPPAAPTGVTGAPQVFDQTGSPAEIEDLAVFRRQLDALENKDLVGYLATMTDDIEVDTGERAQPMRGKDDLRAYYKGLHKAIGQLDTTINNAWGIAQFAVVEYDIAGEQLGPIGWIPAQRDKVLRLHIADLAAVRDGKVARIRRYANLNEIAGP